MYEMYPQIWAAEADEPAPRPRRRPRREHCVLPAVIVRQIEVAARPSLG